MVRFIFDTIFLLVLSVVCGYNYVPNTLIILCIPNDKSMRIQTTENRKIYRSCDDSDEYSMNSYGRFFEQLVSFISIILVVTFTSLLSICLRQL